MPGVRSWLSVWTRAVIVPAGQRASAAWLGCALVVGLLFGGNGLQPRDVTGLALHHAGVAAVLIATWLLIFVPTARVLVRADAASYLRSLPAPRVAPRALAIAALVGLQLPWLALWVLGEGARGLAIVALLTLVIAGLARLRAPRPARRTPAWRSGLVALAAVYRRALVRRAGDALVRGAGLAILAGGTAGLFVRNNALVGGGAAVMGASVIAIVGVPASVGPLLVLVETHRASAWLAASLGLGAATRTVALALAVALLQLAASTIAIIAAVLVADAGAQTIVALAATSLAIALGTALGGTRVLLAAAALDQVATRAVSGAVAVAALAVLCLGVFGAAAGVAAFGACALAALLTTRPETAR